jgi:hypothetical protein
MKWEEDEERKGIEEPRNKVGEETRQNRIRK